VRIVFLAVDDEFAGLMQQPLYEQHPDWVVGSVISTCAIYKKRTPAAVWFVLRKSGLRYFLEMARMKLLRRFTDKEEKITPSRLAKQHDVPIIPSFNINSPESLDALRALKPEIVISTNFSHYIGKKARGVASIGTWNLHKAYLPQYRGMAPSFFALLEGAEQVGCTLHVVAKGFDTGDILCQVAVPVGADDTVYSLNKRTADAGGKMMAKFLARDDIATVQATPQPDGDWKSYTYPTPREVNEFFRKGLRF
jgi:folate-dependent phosphoribosylglycinamide formyltransferase PurN